MSKLVILNRSKKQKSRGKKDRRASENSVKFERTKGQCGAKQKKHISEERHLDNLKRDP